MESSSVSAVLFAKNLDKVTRSLSDEYHWALNGYGFDLIVHQIPKHIVDEIAIREPPERRVWGGAQAQLSRSQH